MTNKDGWECFYNKKPFSTLAREHTTKVEKKMLNRYVKGDRILEAGCGLAKSLQAINDGNRELVGIDQSKIALKRAEEIFYYMGIKARFELGNILDIDYPDNHFDTVISHGVIEHFERPELLIKELMRVGKRNIILYPTIYSLDGLINVILIFLDKLGLYDSKNNFPHNWCYFFTKGRFDRMINRLGYKITYSKRIGIVPIIPIKARWIPEIVKNLLLSLEDMPLPKREIMAVVER